MTVVRSFAIAASFAAVAVGAAWPASADAEMSGHYIETSTNPGTGNSTTNDWYITPCGDVCADVVENPGKPAEETFRATLVNGQWTGDTPSTSANCADGSLVLNAIDGKFKWDPNTLAGTGTATLKLAACGRPAGSAITNNIQLTKAP